MSKQVAKKQETNLAPVADTLDLLEEYAGAGFEDTNADDFVLPFIKKVEHQSKCLQKQHEKYVAGAEAGQLVHNVMMKSFDKVYMIPVKYDNFLQHYKFPDGTGGWLGNYKFNSPDVPDYELLTPNNKGALKLPSYGLVDLGATYFINSKLSFRANINNLFDTEYIAESNSNIHASTGSETWNGVDKRNYVWYGFGTTWNMSLKYRF